MQELPWKELYRIALLELGVAPSEFWQMTSCELLTLLECCKGHSNKDFLTIRNDILQLMQQFPDQ